MDFLYFHLFVFDNHASLDGSLEIRSEFLIVLLDMANGEFNHHFESRM